MSDTILPKLRLPFRIVGGKLATNEQDSAEDVAQCVETICRFEKGDLEDLPEFGITARELSLVTDIAPADTAAEIQKLEPRAAITATGEIEPPSDGTVFDLQIGISND